MKNLDVLGIVLVIVGVLAGTVAMVAGLGSSPTPPTALGIGAGLVSLAAFTGGWLRFREPSEGARVEPGAAE